MRVTLSKSVPSGVTGLIPFMFGRLGAEKQFFGQFPLFGEDTGCGHEAVTISTLPHRAIILIGRAYYNPRHPLDLAYCVTVEGEMPRPA